MKTILNTNKAVKYLHQCLKMGRRIPVSAYFADVEDWFAKSLSSDTAFAARAMTVQDWDTMLQQMAPMSGFFPLIGRTLTYPQIRFNASLLAYFAVSDPDRIMSKEQVVIAMINSLDWDLHLVVDASGIIASTAEFEKRFKVRFKVPLANFESAGLILDLGKSGDEVR